MNKLLVLIAIFGTFIEDLSFYEILDLQSKHAKIGDYPKMQMERCGYMVPGDQYRSTDSGKYIIDGELASLGEFPWQATLFNRDIDWQFCDGTLINRYWVLTARHCFKRKILPSAMNVSFGIIDARKFFRVRNVSLIVKHPNKKMDLALLKLETPMDPVKSEDGSFYRINYACLPNENVSNTMEENAIGSGFGDSDYNHTKNYVLRKVVNVIDLPSECQILRGKPITWICSVVLENSHCYGDSGGPLVQFDGNRAMLIGVLKGGYQFDGAEDGCAPGINFFFRTSYFINFIRDVLVYNETFPEIEDTTPKPSELPSTEPSPTELPPTEPPPTEPPPTEPPQKTSEITAETNDSLIKYGQSVQSWANCHTFIAVKTIASIIITFMLNIFIISIFILN